MKLNLGTNKSDLHIQLRIKEVNQYFQVIQLLLKCWNDIMACKGRTYVHLCGEDGYVEEDSI